MRSDVVQESTDEEQVTDSDVAFGSSTHPARCGLRRSPSCLSFTTRARSDSAFAFLYQMGSVHHGSDRTGVDLREEREEGEGVSSH